MHAKKPASTLPVKGRSMYLVQICSNTMSQFICKHAGAQLGIGTCKNIPLFEALDIYTSAKHKGTLNVSQQVDRMAHSDLDRVQCITPKAVLWHMPSKRPLSGRAQICKPYHWNMIYRVKLLFGIL